VKLHITLVEDAAMQDSPTTKVPQVPAGNGVAHDPLQGEPSDDSTTDFLMAFMIMHDNEETVDF